MPAWATGRRTPLRRTRRISRTARVLLFGGVAALALYLLLPDPPLDAGVSLAGAVERVADGDTLELGGQRLRLVGLDAPEWDQTCSGANGDWPCGRAAATRLRELVRGMTLACRGAGRDHYGRLLGTCMAGEADIGAVLVREGLAVAAGRYEAAEAEARASRRGIWAGEFVTPADWRAGRGDAGGGTGNPSRFERFIGWLTNLFAS